MNSDLCVGQSSDDISNNNSGIDKLSEFVNSDLCVSQSSVDISNNNSGF